jgi:hypothetical protein
MASVMRPRNVAGARPVDVVDRPHSARGAPKWNITKPNRPNQVIAAPRVVGGGGSMLRDERRRRPQRTKMERERAQITIQRHIPLPIPPIIIEATLPVSHAIDDYHPSSSSVPPLSLPGPPRPRTRPPERVGSTNHCNQSTPTPSMSMIHCLVICLLQMPRNDDAPPASAIQVVRHIEAPPSSYCMYSSSSLVLSLSMLHAHNNNTI